MRNLNPRLLLPSLLKYRVDKDRPDMVVKYLETCIFEYGNSDMAVHNFLLARYLESPKAAEKIVAFINRKVFLYWSLHFIFNRINTLIASTRLEY